jgi:regulator of protease activity HflC (stomatin/prohibitin superfamily)
LAGLAIQTGLAAAMAMAAAWTRSDALVAAAWHMVGGLPIWGILALVFGQLEVEGRESLAAERGAATDAGAAALFVEQDDELRRTRRRLDSLVRYGIPAVSLIVGTYLIAAGLLLEWRFVRLVTAIDEGMAVAGHPVGILFASASMAIVAFGTGRWVSGCGQVAAWRLLRGGASYLMSCFVVAGVVTGAALVAAVAKDTRFFGLVAAAVPIVMIVVGCEILGTCILDLYRPRTTGEIARPAFDSRLLGLLTTPQALGDVIGELIRYQFGVEVTGHWLYRLLGRAVTPLVVLAGAVLLALSCLMVVGPDEEGVVLRWGAIRGAVRPAGVHFKLPWPIETVVTHPTRRVQHLAVSSGLATRRGDAEPILWATGDDRLGLIGAEYYPVALPATAGARGLAVIDAEIVVQYRVRDLHEFLTSAASPQAAVAAVAQQEAGRFFAGHELDALLSRGRTEAGGSLAASIQTRLDAMRLGLEVVDVSITSLQPPAGKVARAFHRQIAARQDRETLVERAHRDAVATLSRVAGSVDLGRRIDEAILALDALRSTAASVPNPAAADPRAARQAEIDALLAEAGGEAAQRIHAARGDRWSVAVGEQVARERFVAELQAFNRAPAYYRAARFFAVLAEGLAQRRKFVVAGDKSDLPVVRMDFADPASAIETLLGE